MKRILITFGVVILILLGTAEPASAQECADVSGVGTVCARLVNDEIVVSVLGVQVAKLDAPVVSSTVRVNIPGPAVTVPGPERTIRVSGPRSSPSTITRTI